MTVPRPISTPGPRTTPGRAARRPRSAEPSCAPSKADDAVAGALRIERSSRSTNSPCGSSATMAIAEAGTSLAQLVRHEHSAGRGRAQRLAILRMRSERDVGRRCQRTAHRRPSISRPLPFDRRRPARACRAARPAASVRQNYENGYRPWLMAGKQRAAAQSSAAPELFHAPRIRARFAASARRRTAADRSSSVAVRRLRQDPGEVATQRTERRVPDDRGTDRALERLVERGRIGTAGAAALRRQSPPHRPRPHRSDHRSRAASGSGSSASAEAPA